MLLLIAGSAWITISTEHSLHQKHQPKVAVDAYFKDSTYKQFNNEGKLILVIHSPKLSLIKGSNSLLADHPKITAYNTDGSHWKITGDKLVTDTKTHASTLSGHCILYRRAHGQSPKLTIITDHLTLYPHDKAVTNAPVIFKQGDGLVVHGVGCVLDLKTNTVKIVSQTDALIIPDKPKTENQ